MISIIIPLYNRAEKFIKTLESIARQTYSDYEVIIVNDGSNDQPDLVFAKYFEKLKTNNNYLFLNQKNQGAPAARNRGFRESKGDYLFFCDADAVLEPRALETMLEYLNNHTEASYAYSSFYWGKKLFKLEEFSIEKLKQMPCIHSMSLIRRRDFPTALWDEKIKKFQDWDLWLTMLEEGHIGVYIPEVLYKISPGGTISSWLPSFAYKLFPFLPSVKKYKLAKKIIQEKHVLL